ncbi:hypothetical protein GCM10022415_06720 [Knoellia locipacati]|uniref:DUF2231 domain-containing protein n=1 Tax=Knoellia locipacati TaxID=882824 RepID=A0A512SXD3_9MICO|nr:DUF2231 domain-containing protein [Knoellia locipacati]GEQ12623.1 hypothetical protein KLO01_06700 [Knoellia locipacati]
MFDLINGIPLHPLVVHAIVVLLPLATLGTIAIAVRPRWRRSYGPLVVAAAALAAVLSPVATQSGEALERRVGDPGVHAELGDTLVFFAIALTLASAALVWLERRASSPTRAASAGGSRLTTVVAIVAVVIGLASAVQVYRVGDSGARAAWGDAATQSGRP